MLASALATVSIANAQPAPPTTPSPPAARCVPIAGGTFTMGSPAGDGNGDERPEHAVTVAPFCIDRTEVTVAEYRACVDAGRCQTPGQYRRARGDDHTLCNWGRPGHDDHPLNCVDATMAEAFCAWRGGHLPTEDQWEFAARGSAGRRFPWGNALPTPRSGNLCGAECSSYTRLLGLAWGAGIPGWRDAWTATAPASSLPAAGSTPEGVVGMAGNVWEWTSTPWGPYTARNGDATVYASADPNRRVIRGGGWSSGGVTAARAAGREWRGVTYIGIVVGFRCVDDAR